jgi:hypothetical protein
MVYSQIVILRIALSWYIYINPYTFPWCYLAAAVDWTEDVLHRPGDPRSKYYWECVSRNT